MRLDKLFFLSICSVAMSIPLFMLANNIFIIISFIVSIIYGLKHGIHLGNWNKLYSLFVAMILLMTIALIYTNDISNGLKRIEYRLVYLIIPVLFFFTKHLITDDLRYKCMRAFVWSTFLTSLFFLLNATYKTYKHASPNPLNEINQNFFSYFEFTSILENTHPIYFGVYVLFSLFIVGYDFLYSKGILTLNKTISIVVLMFFTCIVLLLNSFMLTGLLILTHFFFIKVFYQKRSTSIIPRFYLVLLIIITMLASSRFLVNKARGIDFKKDIQIEDFSGTNFTALKARVAKNYCSIKLIRDNFWIGVGPGDAQSVLNTYYVENGFNYGKAQNFNSHNQYLTEWIYTGLFGVFLLIGTLSYLFIKSYKNKNLILFYLTFIISLLNFTESSLVRNKGIVFFVFFACLLFNSPSNTQKARIYAEE